MTKEENEMATLAQLKRDAKSGMMSLKLINRMGDTGEAIPETMRGFRKVVGANTVALKILRHDGKDSELRIQAASLMDYDGKKLVIYNPGYREPTEHERAALHELHRLQNQNPYSEPYWISKRYFLESDVPWMSGYETVKGQKYDWSRKQVRDSRIKGDICLEYEVKIV